MSSSHRFSGITRRCLVAVVAAAACAGWSGRAAATPSYVSSVVVGCNGPATTVSTTARREALECTAGPVRAEAGTVARPGFVGAIAFTNMFLSSTGPIFSGLAQASSTMRDSFVVAATDASGQPVTSGIATIVIGVEASASAEGIAGSLGSVVWAFDVGPFSTFGRVLATSNNPTDFFGDSFAFPIPWTSTTPVTVTFRATAEGSIAAGAAGSYSGLGSFDQSLEWRGISSVTDSAGNPVASFTALSPDGFDYSVAVPEPGSIALVAIGLAGLARAGRARERSARTRRARDRARANLRRTDARPSVV